MSGWYYMKDGWFDDSEKGPVADATLLQMAFGGELKPKTKVRHESHTNNQWRLLEHIPAAKKRIEDGIVTRACEADEAAVAMEIAATERRNAVPILAEAVDTGEAPRQLLPEKVIAWLTTSRLGKASFIAFGVLCVIVLALLNSRVLPTKTTSKTEKKRETIVVYAPINDLVCATDPKFLDSSPLVAPARFARIDAGTEVVKVDVGGMFTGNLYWGLSAGGRMRIYIYRDAFEQKFKEVRTIQR